MEKDTTNTTLVVVIVVLAVLGVWWFRTYKDASPKPDVSADADVGGREGTATTY